MKANHSSGDVLLVRQKKDHPFQELRDLTDRWLSRSFGEKKREKQYLNIDRVIICEQLLGNGILSPTDYHVFTFIDDDSRVHQFIRVISGRESTIVKSLHMPDWSLAPFEISKGPSPKEMPPKPKKLDDALKLAQKLIGQHKFMRVDFYFVDENIYVGELTLTPASGRYKFSDKNVDLYLGSLFGSN